MIRWLARKVTGRKEGAVPAERFVIEVMRSSGIRKGVAGLGGFPSNYSPAIGFYASVFALADYSKSVLDEHRELPEFLSTVLPMLFSNERAGYVALQGVKAHMASGKFMDLVVEIQERIEKAHMQYATGPCGEEYLIEEMSFIQDYL